MKSITISVHNGKLNGNSSKSEPPNHSKSDGASESKRYQCPHCRAVLETEETIKGIKVTCPECNKEFIAIPLSIPQVPNSQSSLTSLGNSIIGEKQTPTSRKSKKWLIAIIILLLVLGSLVGGWYAGLFTKTNRENERHETTSPSLPAKTSSISEETTPLETKPNLNVHDADSPSLSTKPKLTSEIKPSVEIKPQTRKNVQKNKNSSLPTKATSASRKQLPWTRHLDVYSPTIDAALKADILQSTWGQCLGTILGLVAQGRDGEKLAKELGNELTGQSPREMLDILTKRGLKEVADSVRNTSSQMKAALAVNGYPYVNRLKFWRGVILEEFTSQLFKEATAGYRRGRKPNPANLSQEEMAEILGALGLDCGAKLNDRQKQFITFASHFNLDNIEEKEAFAQSLIEVSVILNGGNLDLHHGMRAEEVFERIIDIAMILALEAGTPETAIVQSTLSKLSPTETDNPPHNKKIDNTTGNSSSSTTASSSSTLLSLATNLVAVLETPNKKTTTSC